MFSNPIAAYQQVDRESDIRGADPHRLVMLLFDGAVAALVEAEAKLAEKNYGDKSNALVKAIAIINDGLCLSLNLDEGGELAQNLNGLYRYMVTRLLHANIQNDVGAMIEVRGLLEELGGAWREMGAKLKREVAAGSNTHV